MHSFNVLVALFAATSAAWPGANLFSLEVRKQHEQNGTMSHMGHGNSTDRACEQITKLTRFTDFAANQTKLNDLVAKGKLNATEVQDIQTKAADAKTKLQTLEANTTLTSECAVIDANKKTVGDCRKIKELTKLTDMANNQTALAAFEKKKDLNATGVADLTKHIAMAQTELTKLKSNTTLTSFCAQREQDKGQTSDGDASKSTKESRKAASSGAAGLTLQSMPYVFLPALAAVFAVAM